MYLSLRRGRDNDDDSAEHRGRTRQPSTSLAGAIADPSLVGRNVVMLGLTSLFTDISSEMVIAVLPIYLTVTVGWSTIGYGLFDGLFSLIDSVFRLVGGATADHTSNHKRVAASGYGLAAATRVGLIASTIVAIPIIPFLLLERVGKGIRSAPRDALISLSSAPGRLGLSFGVHRALDTIGALLGPFVAFWLLRLVPGSFDSIFVVSLVVALIGVLIIVMLVEPHPVKPAPADAAAQETPEQETPESGAPESGTPEPGAGSDTGNGPLNLVNLLRTALVGALSTRATSRTAVVAFMFGVTTISDGFLYLIIANKTSLSLATFPLLFAASAIVYLLLAVPVGAIADRVGRTRVFIAGHGALVILYLLLVTGDQLNWWFGAAALALVGLFYACTDGVLAALVSAQSEPDLRSSAIATVGVAGSLGRLVSSVIFGAAWFRYGLSGPLWVAASAVAVAALAGAAMMTSTEEHGN